MDILKPIIGHGAVVLFVAVFMEGVAWFTHRYVMHGFLWVLHEDHHHPRGGGFQKNDLFAVFFSGVAVLLFLVGALTRDLTVTAVAIGVTLYGVGYMLFHDVMFHRRIPGIRIRATTPYLKRIVRAHTVHHQNSGKEGGIAFGFLYAPPRYRVK